VRDGTILDPQKCFYGEVINPDVKVDCGERLIAAGYIETQINGLYNYYTSFITYSFTICNYTT